MHQPEPTGRRVRTLHPALRVALYLPALALGSVVFALPISLLLRALAISIALPADIVPAGSEFSDIGLVLQAFSMLGIVTMTYVFRRLLDRRSFASLGLQLGPGWVRETLIGFGVGVLLMSMIFVIELALGGYRLLGFALAQRSAESILLGLVVMLCVFVFVSFSEELISRGYLLQNLAAAWGVPVGVVLSSALFAVAHLFNPNAGLISTLGIFVAGVQLAAGYLVTGRLWLPMGLHLSWNFFQGPVFGFRVSGIETGGLLVLDEVGPPLLSGGEFGPEASLVGLAVDVFGIWLLWWWGRRRARSTDSRPLLPRGVPPT